MRLYNSRRLQCLRPTVATKFKATRLYSNLITGRLGLLSTAQHLAEEHMAAETSTLGLRRRGEP